MRNLLQETINILKDNDKAPEDVLWVGCTDFKSSWDNFKEVADTTYEEGFGGTEVARDLMIVGRDFWLERHEYDGSEWWEFKSIPIEPSVTKTILAVTECQSEQLGFENYWEDTLSKYNGFE